VWPFIRRNFRIVNMKNSQNSKPGSMISRRVFVNQTVAGSVFIAVGPLASMFPPSDQEAASWPADASKYRLHMIGHAHIDPVWLWPWSEGMAVVHSTFRSALDRMNETPDFTFISSSAQFYQWVAENDPQMLSEIRKRVDEGRWNVVGGWWVEPDVNIPCGEALVRQGLYGQLTLQHLLGRKAIVAFNPDSFGHTGTLPQILKLQEMENYIFMRPGVKEKTLPADIFWWEGPDGTRVLTYRIPISYNDNGSVRKRIEQEIIQFKNQPVNSLMAYYGAGDHGGGATKENIASINELKSEKGVPVVFYSTPERYFKEIREYKKVELPVVSDDLQHHAVGCYTAESEIKKGNRASEAALIAAEKIAAIGSVAWSAYYPKAAFDTAWKKVLFLQFHDSLAGSSLPEHSQTAREGYGFALDTAHLAAMKAVQKLEWQVATEDPSSQYLIAFNPHAWEVSGIMEYDLNWNLSIPSRVEDEKGNALPYQWSAGSTETGSRRKLVFRSAVPAFGYRQIRLLKGEAALISGGARAADNKLENEFLKVSFSPDGKMGVLDKRCNKEVFTGGENGCRAVMINDPSDTWSHDIKSYSEEIGAFGNAEIKVLENGPLRASIRIRTTYGASILTIDWILCAGSDNLEAKVTLDWHEHLRMVKFSFPVDVESPVATYETAYGHIVRDTNGNEEPGQRWIDVTGKSKSAFYGLTVLNDAKYGYSVAGSDMRISVARSAVYAHHNPKVLDLNAEHNWMDQGMQSFRMLLVPHTGRWEEAGISRIAEEFTARQVVIYQGIHGGSMPKSGSFLNSLVPNVIITAVKQAENGEEIIIRCVEAHGQKTNGEIDLRFAGKKWSGSFRPFEIKTLKVDTKSGNVKEVNLLEE
jgi:alpha-mannosidase